MITLRQIRTKSLPGVLIVQFNIDHVNSDTENSRAPSIVMKNLGDILNIVRECNGEGLLRQSESFEYYRPDSFTDATKDPFNSKKYQFKNLKDSILN
jgi:hypothetical protein